MGNPSDPSCVGYKVPVVTATTPPPASSSASYDPSNTVLAEDLLNKFDLEYWLCIREAISSKVNPINLKVFTTIIKNLEGRDKVTKFIQYGCRYLSWAELSRDSKSELGQLYDSMSKQGSLSRRYFHLFRSLEEIDRIKDLLKDQKLSEWRRNILILKAASWVYYWYYNNKSFLITMKVIKSDAYTSGKKENWAWVAACLITIVMSIYDIKEHHFKRTRTRRQLMALTDAPNQDGVRNEIAEIRKKITAENEAQFLLMSDLVKACCDLMVAANAPGVDLAHKVLGRKLHGGEIGGAGVIASLLALYRVLPNRVKTGQ